MSEIHAPGCFPPNCRDDYDVLARCPQLPVSAIPFESEGFAEFFIRVSALNGYISPWTLWAWLNGRRSVGTHSLGKSDLTITDGNIDRVSHFVGAPRDAIEKLRETGSTRAELLHRGIEFRRGVVNMTRRRVSPRALSSTPSLKFVWRVDALGFDLENGEKLLKNCPSCLCELGFAATVGLVYCDKCYNIDEWPIRRVDLREFPQELIEVEDEASLEFMRSLIEPNSDKWRSKLPYAPFDVTGITGGKLFDLILAFARLIDNDGSPYNPQVNAVISLGRNYQAPAFRVAEASRMVMDWSKKMPLYAEYFAAKPDSRNKLYFCLRRVGMSDAVIQSSHWMRIEAESRAGKIVGRGASNARHFTAKKSDDSSRFQIEGRIAALRMIPFMTKVARTIGLPMVTMLQLAHEGVFSRNLLEENLSREILERELAAQSDALRRKASARRDRAKTLSISYVVFCLTLDQHLAWGAVFKGILDGVLDFHLSPLSNKFTNSAQVSDFHAVRALVQNPNVVLGGTDQYEMTNSEARIYLNTQREYFYSLQCHGLIANRCTTTDLRRFRSNYMTQGEIVARFWMGGNRNAARAIVAQLATLNLPNISVGNTTFYERNAVETRLADRMISRVE